MRRKRKKRRWINVESNSLSKLSHSVNWNETSFTFSQCFFRLFLLMRTVKIKWRSWIQQSFMRFDFSCFILFVSFPFQSQCRFSFSLFYVHQSRFLSLHSFNWTHILLFPLDFSFVFDQFLLTETGQEIIRCFIWIMAKRWKGEKCKQSPNQREGEWER